MKFQGKTLAAPKPKKLGFTREDEDGNDIDIVFVACAVLDFDEFNERCPAPKPPIKQRPGKTPIVMSDDPNYLKKQKAFHEQRIAWLCLKSLEASEGLVWETVDMTDPDTWTNFEDELAKIFTPTEIDTIVQLVFDANLPNDETSQQAIDRFFQQQQAQGSRLSSEKGDQISTTLGEDVND